MLISSRKANPEPEIAGLHIIAALIILLREIIVSGLREFLAELKVEVKVSRLAKWKTTFQLVSLGALISWPRAARLERPARRPHDQPAAHRRPYHVVGRRDPDGGDRLGLPARRPQAYGLSG